MPSAEYLRKLLGLREHDIQDEIALNNHLATTRQHSEAHFINCWQLFEGETRYKKYGNGVAIFSRFDLLKSQLERMLDPIFAGIVRYGDKDMTGNNVVVRFAYTKQRYYSNERGLRLLLGCYDPVAACNRHIDINNHPHAEPLDANPLHTWVHGCKRRRINLEELLTEIRLSPSITQERADEVAVWAKCKNISCPITRSDLTPQTQ